jgi:hypothetical protein
MAGAASANPTPDGGGASAGCRSLSRGRRCVFARDVGGAPHDDLCSRWFIDQGGNDFWGVQLADTFVGGRRVVAYGDRDCEIS